jgi:hypothetical protein
LRADRGQGERFKSAETYVEPLLGIKVVTTRFYGVVLILKTTHCRIGKSTDSEYLHELIQPIKKNDTATNTNVIKA